MPWINSNTRRLIALQLLLVVLLFSLPGQSLVADAFSDRRAHVGLKLFRTLVAADMQVVDKVSADGSLPIYLVYATNNSMALDYQQTLTTSLSSVRDLPVTIRVFALEDILAKANPKPAAMFITQRLNETELQQLIQFSIANQILLFSPFEGDVEQGVLGGLSVEATVRPLINIKTLNASQLHIKNFYLKVAKHYE